MPSHPLAPLIDHTLLKPDATKPQIDQLCAEASENGFASVCVNPYWIADARKRLEGSSVRVCTVIGFPLGATLSRAKIHEAADAISAGADELDIVMNIGAALEGHWNFIEHEIHDLVDVAAGRIVKVILETCLLNEDQIRHACEAATRGRAHFVKTSTGFSIGGATVEVVRLMRASVPESMGVKASGGIRTAADAQSMVEAGANRLGTSNGVAIIRGTKNTSAY